MKKRFLLTICIQILVATKVAGSCEDKFDRVPIPFSNNVFERLGLNDGEVDSKLAKQNFQRLLNSYLKKYLRKNYSSEQTDLILELASLKDGIVNSLDVIEKKVYRSEYNKEFQRLEEVGLNEEEILTIETKILSANINEPDIVALVAAIELFLYYPLSTMESLTNRQFIIDFDKVSSGLLFAPFWNRAMFQFQLETLHKARDKRMLDLGKKIYRDLPMEYTGFSTELNRFLGHVKYPFLEGEELLLSPIIVEHLEYNDIDSLDLENDHLSLLIYGRIMAKSLASFSDISELMRSTEHRASLAKKSSGLITSGSAVNILKNFSSLRQFVYSALFSPYTAHKYRWQFIHQEYHSQDIAFIKSLAEEVLIAQIFMEQSTLKLNENLVKLLEQTKFKAPDSLEFLKTLIKTAVSESHHSGSPILNDL